MNAATSMQMLSLSAIKMDERCQPRTTINPEVIDEYASAMKGGAEFPPLTVYRDGGEFYLADGFHRHAAAIQAGKAHFHCEVEPGTIRDAILHAVGANASHGMRRTNADKRRAVETLLNDEVWSGWSNNEIANKCGVSHTFVNGLRSSLESVSSEMVGRTFTNRYGNQSTMNTSNIGRASLDSHRGSIDSGEAFMSPVDEDGVIHTPWYSLPVDEPKQPHVSHNSGENEWYTPAEYIEAAREVMGSIDLDPASSDIANERVQATRYFTKEDNGLAKEWHGNVWMNPPYAQPLMGMFADKVVEEFDAGRIDSAIVLVNNATETRWYHQLGSAASSCCEPLGRIRYITPDGNPANTPLQGQKFMYLGDDPEAFKRVFRQFGLVWDVA